MPLHIVSHPVVQDILLRLRDRATPPDTFRVMARRISLLLAAEATRDIPSREASVQTPLATAGGRAVDAEVVVVPVLRAGLGMLDAVLDLVPTARVGHIGLQRRCIVFVVDPMLATGGSAVAAIDLLRSQGARDIRLLCIVAAPEGVAVLEAAHPEVRIYTPVVDAHLNEMKFIVPGLGDFGDRLFGTGVE
ncbi:MAG: uracil phosphoribosyltransferase [Vicinamibacterales bacterium]|nr:uracil phosphoribosyltransferase [Vicinamibacterales bacterium]